MKKNVKMKNIDLTIDVKLIVFLLTNSVLERKCLKRVTIPHLFGLETLIA
jgi:hypothetical protein